MTLFVVYMLGFDCQQFLYGVHATEDAACAARAQCQQLDALWQYGYAQATTLAPCLAEWYLAKECKGHRYDMYLDPFDARERLRRCHPGHECAAPQLNLCVVQQVALGVDDVVHDVWCPEPGVVQLP